MPASGRAVSTVGLFGALGALTGASTVLALGLHVLTRAERARNHDEQAAATGPKPLMQVRPKQVRPKQVRPKQVRPKQVPPMQAKEEEWSASPAGPCSPSVPSLPQRPPMGSPLVSHTAAVDADGLRLRRRSHTRALRGLRCWLRVQGYRPPVPTRRPMITVSCRHVRPVRSRGPTTPS